MELLSKLGIDLKLLLAQIVNFLILFVVLSKLVYKPIINLLEKRKKLIEKTVEDQKSIEERLTKIEEEKGKVMAEATAAAMAVVEKSKKEAEEEKQKVLTNAKKEISSLAERYRAQLKEEKANIVKEIKGEMAVLIVKASEKVIRKEFAREDQKRLEQAIKDELSSTKI